MFRQILCSFHILWIEFFCELWLSENRWAFAVLRTLICYNWFFDFQIDRWFRCNNRLHFILGQQDLSFFLWLRFVWFCKQHTTDPFRFIMPFQLCFYLFWFFKIVNDHSSPCFGAYCDCVAIAAERYAAQRLSRLYLLNLFAFYNVEKIDSPIFAWWAKQKIIHWTKS